MKNKTCGECSWFSDNRCKLHNNQYIFGDRAACKDYKQKQTNGEKIIAGGMRAIAEFAKNRCLHCIYKNSDFEAVCLEVDCADGMEAWLNAPAESEGEDE